jgi:hypothetical protein
LVYPVFIFCILQIFGVTLFIFEHVAELEGAVSSGAVSIQGVLVGYLYPFTLFLGGLFLLFMRKLATVFFAIYAVWGIVRLLVPTGHSTSPAAIAVAVLFLAYSSYLLKEGRLA